MHYISENEWYVRVFKLAGFYGYTEQQIRMFLSDIEYSFNNGDTPEQCIEKVF